MDDLELTNIVDVLHTIRCNAKVDSKVDVKNK